MIRKAMVADIPDLLRIENAAFTSDRFTERNFHHLITRAHGRTLVAIEPEAGIVGYATVLFNRGTSLARLYSMATDPTLRRRGVGARLLAAIEEEARADGNAYMRLEVRVDNVAAQRMYEKAGYQRFAVSADYYEDGVDAYRMEKSLAPHLDASRSRVPYYEQSLDFTCGAAALMMAMKALGGGLTMDRKTELRLWRESTTVFMCSGHGGCGPYGLALAAARRGFEVWVYVSDEGVLFADSVRSQERRQAMELVQEDFLDQLRETSVEVAIDRVGTGLLEDHFERGHIPIVLISTYRLDRQKQPHWVAVTGFDRQFIYVHDPFVDYPRQKTPTDRMHLPILRRDFERMARYGKSQLKAAVILGKDPESHGTTRRRGRKGT